jgi:hypothetical protein
MLAAPARALGCSGPGRGWLSDRSSQRWGLILMACSPESGPDLDRGRWRGHRDRRILLGASATSIMQTQVMTLIGDRTGSRAAAAGHHQHDRRPGQCPRPAVGLHAPAGIGLSGLFWLAAGLLVCALPLIAGPPDGMASGTAGPVRRRLN